MNVYLYWEFPDPNLRDATNGSKRRLPPGRHIIRLLGALYLPKKADSVRYVAYFENLADRVSYSMLLTKGKEFECLDGIIRSASYGSFIYLHIGAIDAAGRTPLLHAGLVWDNVSGGAVTPKNAREEWSIHPNRQAFQRVVKTVALNRPGAKELLIPLAWECGSGPLRILVVSLRPPLLSYEYDLESSRTAGDDHNEDGIPFLGNLAAWLELAAKRGGGHILDAAFPSPTKLRRQRWAVGEIAASVTGFPALYRKLREIHSSNQVGEVKTTSSVFHLFLSPLPCLNGEREDACLKPEDDWRSFEVFFDLIKPDIVILSGRIVVRKIGSLMRPQISSAPFLLSHLRKPVDPNGYPWPSNGVRHVLQSYRGRSGATFIAAPDLRFFKSGMIQRQLVTPGYWEVLEATIAKAAWKAPNCTVPPILADPPKAGGIGLLDMVTLPSEATVEIDGAGVSFGPVRGWKLPAGEHYVSVSNTGYQTRKFLVTIRADQTNSWLVELPPAVGSLSVESTPPGLRVSLHLLRTGEPHQRCGTTPVSFSNLKPSKYWIKADVGAYELATEVEVTDHALTRVILVESAVLSGTKAEEKPPAPPAETGPKAADGPSEIVNSGHRRPYIKELEKFMGMRPKADVVTTPASSA